MEEQEVMTPQVYEAGRQGLLKRPKKIANFGGRSATSVEEWDAVARASGFDPNLDWCDYVGAPIEARDDADLTLDEKMSLRLKVEVMDLPEVREKIEGLEAKIVEVESQLTDVIDEVGSELIDLIALLEGGGEIYDEADFPILSKAMAIYEETLGSLVNMIRSVGEVKGEEAVAEVIAVTGEAAMVPEPEPEPEPEKVPPADAKPKGPAKRPTGKGS